uniref:Uncharacterized protein n=1 Tax=Candidatus Kentrum sp. TC TaxID=2126339 RepID=A0A450YRT2_9GAMM|nr:MAG: hypothetical protein BECKTC1821E_GA0114239_10333 [Candidatus Kentron sp. TC]
MGGGLAAYPGTSEQLANEIEIVEDEISNAIVLGFSAYWGWETGYLGMDAGKWKLLDERANRYSNEYQYAECNHQPQRITAYE